MSFDRYKDTIEEGDTVILYLTPKNLHAIQVLPKIKNKNEILVDNVFQTQYGALKVSSLIGIKFGSKVELSNGWAYVLHPTPELWTLTLPHRTQIIYTPDISMIILQLEIAPGSVVIESGTGSGSLTHALARCVQPNGTVYTFDFHEQRVKTAQEEFECHKISQVVKVMQRDVCASGFGDDIEGKADAVFLDLPHPWLVVGHASKSFKKTGGRFCSFSPCIEQVQRTCKELSKEGFVEIITMEVLQRELIVVKKTLPAITLKKDCDNDEEPFSFMGTTYAPTLPGHTGYLTFASLPPVWARSVSSDEASPETLNLKLETEPHCDGYET